MSTDLLSDLITQAEAARLRRCSRQAIAKLVKQGKLQTFMIAGRRLLSKAEVKRYEVKPAGRPAKR